MTRASVAPSALGHPARIGERYRIEGRLGAGGMGIVYRAYDEAAKKTVALKLLQPRAGQSTEGDTRSTVELLFRREFQTLASLKHPRIIEAFDYGVDRGRAYYTMELLDGSDLRERRVVGALEACRLLRDVASALAFLHARKLLHRDVASRNVRCTSDGRAKLIDFGALATVGFVGEVVGTPPYMPPESLAYLPLDPRSDLFGLGALAYWLLTGRHAFPARTAEELLELWRKPPAPPSSLQSTVPRALDELVLSMLSVEWLARPASAAEVIDRLGAIAGLEPSSEREIARGYLSSAAVCGRATELSQLEGRLADAVSGRGGAVLVEGGTGLGKSRLLREVDLLAQLAGATVLRADRLAAGRGPWGIVRALAAQLMAAAPERSLRALGPHAAMIARVVPEIARRLGPQPEAPPEGDPREERAVLQTALVRWLGDVTRAGPCVILVDDLERCDEASASVLAALAHEAGRLPLLLAVALRSAEGGRAPAAIARLRTASTRLRLHELTSEQVEELARSLFGDVPDVGRLGRFMHASGGGSPLHVIEVARHLVESGVVRYAEDIWVVPAVLTAEQVPQSLAAAMEGRVRALSDDARSVLELMAVYGRDMPLWMLVELAEIEEDRIFTALDELVADEIVIGSGQSHRVRHEGLREAALRGATETHRRELHRRVATVLTRHGEVDAELEGEVGWHFLRGGDPERGAELLERAGRRLSDTQSFADAVAPLEAALAVYERQGQPPSVCLELRFLLVRAGFLCDRSLTEKYADKTLSELQRHSGVATAARLGPIVGRHLALFLGLAWAVARWLVTPRRRRGPRPSRAIRMFVLGVVYSSAVASVMLDARRLDKLRRLIRPMGIFERSAILYGTYILTHALYLYVRGETREVERIALRRIPTIAGARGLTDMERKLAEGGYRFLVALMAAQDTDPRAAEHFEALEKFGLKVWEVAAAQLRMVYHLMRGEEEAAQEQRVRCEQLLLQFGSAWQMEAWVPLQLCFTSATNRNVLGLKRAIELLDAQTREAFRYEPFLELARGAYHRERGEIGEALRHLERSLELLGPEQLLSRPIALSALAETLLDAGQLDRAEEAATQAVAIGEAQPPGNQTVLYRAARTLALVQAERGDTDGAARKLDELITQAEAIGSPAMCGSLHEARARVALSTDDRPAFLHHCHMVDAWFRPTRNPVLIARYERLVESGEASRPISGQHVVQEVTRRASAAMDPLEMLKRTVRTLLAQSSSPSERTARALEFLVQAASAASGYLYTSRDGQLVLVAPSYGDEPPDIVPVTLEQAVERNLRGEAPTDDAIVWKQHGKTARFRPIVLVARPRGKPAVVGAAALIEGGTELRAADPDLVETVAQSLYDAGDATSEILRVARPIVSGVGPGTGEA